MSGSEVSRVQEPEPRGAVGPGQCRCGWGDGSDVRTLGRSHSKHVVEQLRAAGTLADAQRPDTSDDDLFTDLDAW